MRVGIIGATGYAGVELVRLLDQHPKVELGMLSSHSFSGEVISDIYPNLKGRVDMICEDLDIDKLAERSEFVFTALPHEVSMKIVPQLLEKGLKVIDLSADYRYENLATYEEWYTKHQSPKLLKEGVYGLVEFNRNKIVDSKLIANPGCYPTASILGLAPLLEEGMVNSNSIIIDAKSGVSGAGRKVFLGTHFCEVTNNFKAYKVTSHRHTSEIEEKLSLLAKNQIRVSFTPHLLPINRGILATIYVDLLENKEGGELLEVYQKYYQDDVFVRIMADGILPELKNVSGSNYCDIGLTVDKRTNRAIIIVAIDNLFKGAAGQAVQNLNVMNGWDEKLGLENVGLYL